MKDLTVALIGNPNSGKTTLFNVVTGAHQRVGNWPGVTVEHKVGHFWLGERRIQLIDLPGIYSLEQDYPALDEKIARDFLAEQNVDLVINIVDASNLERNLILTQQLLDQGHKVVMALNMLDVAHQQGLEIDARELSVRLGIPVAPVIASRGRGVEEMKRIMTDLMVASRHAEPRVRKVVGARTGSASEALLARYKRAGTLVEGVMRTTETGRTLTESVDRWVLNRWLGIPFFLFMMYLMFTFAVKVGEVFIDFFDILFGAALVDGTRWMLSSMAMPEWIIVLMADGLGGGIQLVATFIPVIGCLFLCLSILEDSGYMSRAAFVVDRLMSRIGLPGNAFVPLIVGFGCNVPAVMASRTLARDSDRLLIIAMAPFMSCGARLTVYALFAAALFPANGQNIVFFLYLLGITVAVFTGWMLRKQIFRQEVTASFQEMPAYHLPIPRNILLTTWFRLKSFMFRAGKMIVTVVIVLSFLNSIGTDGSFGNENTEKSVLSSIGKQITPVFGPIGVSEDNWAATVGLFTGLFAKEAVVGTLDALYSDPDPGVVEGAPDLVAATGEALGSIAVNAGDLLSNLTDPLGISIGNVSDSAAVAEDQGVQTSTLSNMASLFGTQLAAFSYLVFVLLYAPCVATIGAIAREANWRWTAMIFGWSLLIGYVTASCIYQLGTIAEHPLFSILWVTGSGLVLAVTIQTFKLGHKSEVPDNLIQVVQVS